jgi:hypothetical protein
MLDEQELDTTDSPEHHLIQQDNNPVVRVHVRQQSWERLSHMSIEDMRSPRIESLLQKVEFIVQAYLGEKILAFSKFLEFHDLVEKVLNSSLSEKQCISYQFDRTVPYLVRHNVPDKGMYWIAWDLFYERAASMPYVDKRKKNLTDLTFKLIRTARIHYVQGHRRDDHDGGL